MGVRAEESVYGGNVVGSEITGGVDLSPTTGDRHPGGHYDLGHGAASTHAENAQVANTAITSVIDEGSGTLTPAQLKAIRFDPDIVAALAADSALRVSQVTIATGSAFPQLDAGRLAAIQRPGANTEDEGALEANAVIVRRLTSINASGELVLTVLGAAGATLDASANLSAGALQYPIKDDFQGSTAPGSVVGDPTWALEEPLPATRGNFGDNTGKNEMQEIDIKVDSIAVTAQTKKLKAKWSPELGQDLNAYHNLDAEVELTGILSEQIALEIDRELLGELVNGATAGTRYWSRAPGLFVDSNGNELGASSAAPDFTGTVSEWYETLIETINDVSAQIHRKTLRGGANFVVCSPEVANILEFTSGFRASVTADQDRGTIGAVRAGSLSKKFDVYVDPYFLRNVILVGRKGSSFLESGFVYAPYVPLQVTPTIFGTEDFVPRKGVMTRYAKKMVRPDMYGLVVVRGLLGEEGA